MSLRWAEETFATRSGRCLVKTRLDGQYHVGHLDPGRYWDGDMRRPQWLWVVERKTNKLGRWSDDKTVVGRALRGVAPEVPGSRADACPRREETEEKKRDRAGRNSTKEAENGTRIERRGGRTDEALGRGREQETPKNGLLECLWRGSRSGMAN